MKEFTLDNAGPTPEERGVWEITSEKWREFFYQLKKVPPQTKLAAIALLAITPNMVTDRQVETSSETAYAQKEMHLDGHSLEDQEQVLKMQEIIMSEMSPRFVDERQAFIDTITAEYKKFSNSHFLANSLEVFPVEEFSEWINKKQIARQDTVQKEKNSEKGGAEYTTYFEYLADVRGISDGSSPLSVQWQQHASILKVETPKNKDMYDITSEGEPIEVEGVGETEEEALLDARYQAVMQLGGKVETLDVPRKKNTEDGSNDEDSSDGEMNDNTVRIYTKKEAAAFIYSRELLKKEEIKDGRGQTIGVKVVVKVQPGKIELKNQITV